MSLNDPQWGRGRNDGPPDLDELIRNFNRRLSGLFGRRGGGGQSEPPGSGMGLPRFGGGGAGLVAALLALVWIGSGFYIVDAGQRGVVLRFGKYLETTEPGPRWHLPYPFERVDIVNIAQVRTLEIGYRNNVKNKVLKEALMLTDDENIVDIQFALQYVLKSPEDFLFSDRNPDATVMKSAESAMREVVGKNSMDFVLYEGREQVAVQAQKLMQDMLDRYKTGIQISKVTLQNAQPPEQVQSAFDDAVKAGQDRERLKNEAQAYANDVIPRARGTAARLLQEADGYKQRVIERAEGDAARFRQVATEYAKAPGVTRDRLYLDAMQEILTNTSKIVVDQKGGGGSLLYLPLDKLMQQSAAPAPAPAEGAPAQAAPAAPEGAAPAPAAAQQRSRESLRTREREAR
jgi:membrane protease subunit HflK